MSTSYYPPAPTYNYAPGSNPVPTGYQASTNPRTIAENQGELVAGQGQALMANDEQLANEYQQAAAGTQNYLNPIESTLASGQGGYTPQEQSQIELTTQQQQNIVTGAGISSGVGTASAVGAAERAAAAAGGNPEALATYRTRAAQTQGAQAGDSETQARIAAQQAGSQGAQAVGNAAIGEQNQALGYYGNLQAEQTQAGEGEQGLQQQAYGTETSGTGQAAGLGVQASQTPSMFDKITGALASGVGAGVGSAATAAALADGTPYYDGGTDAVIAEAGPEAIINNAPKAVQRAASDPVRSNTRFMEDGNTDDPGAPSSPASATTPWWQKYAAIANQSLKPQSTQQPQQWTKATPYNQLGTAVGRIAGPLVAKALSPAQTSTDPYFAPGSSQMPAASDASTPDLSTGLYADGKLGGAFHWSERTPRTPHTPRPSLNYADRPHLADGGIGNYLDEGAMPAPQPPQIFTKPTMVHLEKADMVVPLSYRPKAKVRPSMALNAMQSAGGIRA